MLNQLPIELENLILDYKSSMEVYDKKMKIMKQISKLYRIEFDRYEDHSSFQIYESQEAYRKIIRGIKRYQQKIDKIVAIRDFSHLCKADKNKVLIYKRIITKIKKPKTYSGGTFHICGNYTIHYTTPHLRALCFCSEKYGYVEQIIEYRKQFKKEKREREQRER